MRAERATNRTSLLWTVAAFGNALLAMLTASYFFGVLAVVCVALAGRAWLVERRTRNGPLSTER